MKGLRAKINSLSLSDLGAGLRALQVASSQRAVLDSLDASLVLCDNVLINTSTGESRQIHSSEPAMLAAAAASLLAERKPSPTVFLLLPPSHFVATRYQLNITGEKLVRSALSLQAHALLPAYDEPLLLGLAGQSGTGTALWFPERRATALHAAFQAEGLLLGAVMPRSLALLEDATSDVQVLQDADAVNQTYVSFANETLSGFLTASQRDLEHDVFNRQWQNETHQIAGAPQHLIGGSDGWRALRRVLKPRRGYAFIPSQAEDAGWHRIRRQQQKVAMVSALVVVALLCVPFLKNAVHKMLLERELETHPAQSAAARESQAAVLAMEDEWGAVLEYPRQDVGNILLELNSAMENSLSNFSVNKGVVEIQGFSVDTAQLIEELAQNEAFYDVTQNRSSSAGAADRSGDRFGIRLGVSGIDFPAYEARYPVRQP